MTHLVSKRRFYCNVIGFFTIASFIFFALLPEATRADDFFVSTTGDDSNPGTSAEPFRTVNTGALSLSPGDTLFVRPGVYEDEGTIFVRQVTEDGLFLPLVGTSTAQSRIIGLTERGRRPIVRSSIDVRGSFISISGLELRGTGDPLLSGIGIFESHDISITDCGIFNFGGSGISFNQCDLVRVQRNRIGFNAFTNPNQSSGISLFQSVVRTNSDARFGAVIEDNICVGNENRVPPTPDSQISDGNGIIVDDFLYTQNTGIVEEAMIGLGSDGGTGIPVIELDEDGNALGYPRSTLVRGNTTLFNGGRGIHTFLSDGVDIISNRSFFNLNSAALTDGLPRDEETNEALFVFGEINLTDSLDARIRGNVTFTREADAAGAAEQFFDRVPEDARSNNRWRRRNSFINRLDIDRDVSVTGVDSSLLLRLGRETR